MKLKSSSSAKKRFRKTGTGKIMQKKSSKNHLLTNKSKRQKKLFPKGMPLSSTNEKRVTQLLPYL